MFEQMHIALMKRAYRASNRREANAQIVKHNRRIEALRIAKQEVECIENLKVDKKTTLHKVNYAKFMLFDLYVSFHSIHFQTY